MATIHDRHLFDDVAMLDFEEPRREDAPIPPRPDRGGRVLPIGLTGAMLLLGVAVHSLPAGVASAAIAAVVLRLVRG